MQTTRFEAALVVLGFLVIAALGVLTALEYADYRERVDATKAPAGLSRPASLPTRPGATATVAATTTEEIVTEAVTETAPAPAPRTTATTRVAAAPTLVLEAARGESWVMARRDSATGPTPYIGTLAAGRTLRLSARRLWLRMGAPSALDARLGGRALTGLPQGVATVLVTPRGVEILQVG